jgi:hypothetical protein
MVMAKKKKIKKPKKKGELAKMFDIIPTSKRKKRT